MARQITEPAAQRERRLPMTYEEYLAWYGEGRRGEWVDGEVIVFVPPNLIHGRLVAFLHLLLAWYARRFNLGEVVIAPFEMRILGVRAARQPDLLFVAREHADRLTLRRLEGPADLVIEIVSADSVSRDRRTKYAEYQAAGIPEYWLLDSRPGKPRADFHRLGAEGTYEAIPLDAAGRVHSVVLPGFWLDPAWLWQDPLPDPDDLKPIILAVGAHRRAHRPGDGSG